jgi:ankyrin repeat protein
VERISPSAEPSIRLIQAVNLRMWRKSYLLFIPGLFIAHAVGQPDDLVQAARRGDNLADGPWTLTSAISHRQPGVVEMLLKLGVNPNAVDANGDYPLDLAAQKGDSQIVQSLLSRGATVNFRNKTGSFPIHTAALNGNTEVVKLLLDQGAEIDCRVSETGETPLFYAASFGRTKTVELLLARGANKNIANKDGITPLAAARKADRQDTANLLR